MIVCPFCEFAQNAGSVCEQCGKQLLSSRAPAVASEPVPGLESTRHPEADCPEAPTLPMADFEPHRRNPAEVEGVERLSEIEPTRFRPDPSAAPAPAPLEDFESTRFGPVGAPAPLPAIPTCRYCGHAQAVGALCDNCGMRLPRPPPSPGAAARAPDAESIVCPGCGIRGRPGSRCFDCGSVFPDAATH